MRELFETRREPVSQDEFIAALERNEHEAQRFKARDETAWKIIEHHQRNKKQGYQLVTLGIEGLDQLILPHHIHDSDRFPEIDPQGDGFWNVVEKYLAEKDRPQQKARECLDKVRALVKLRAWEKHKPFVSNDPDFAVRGHYYGRRFGEFLYGGCFHRLVAYGVWIKESSRYLPLELYYCEVPVDERENNE